MSDGMNGAIVFVFIVIVAILSSAGKAKKQNTKKSAPGAKRYPVQPEDPVSGQTAVQSTAENIRSSVPISAPRTTPGMNMNEMPGEGFSFYPDERMTPAETSVNVEPDDDCGAFEPEDIVNGLIMSEILNRKTR